MSLPERDFESWCFRNGGETYDEEDRPGLTCRFPDTETQDRVAYLSDSGAFEVITDGRFYSTRSLHQNAEAWIDDDDRLHVDTEDTRIAIDPPVARRSRRIATPSYQYFTRRGRE